MNYEYFVIVTEVVYEDACNAVLWNIYTYILSYHNKLNVNSGIYQK